MTNTRFVFLHVFQQSCVLSLHALINEHPEHMMIFKHAYSRIITDEVKKNLYLPTVYIYIATVTFFNYGELYMVNFLDRFIPLNE